MASFWTRRRVAAAARSRTGSGKAWAARPATTTSVFNQVAHGFCLSIDLVAMMVKMALDYLGQVGREVGDCVGGSEADAVQENGHENFAVAGRRKGLRRVC